MVGRAGRPSGRGTERLGEAVFDDAVGRQVGGPGQGEARCGHVGLNHGRGVADARGGNQVHRSAWQELVSTEAVERKLRDDAEQVHGTSGEGLAHKAVAGADVDDAGLSVCGEIVGVVARDFLTGEREGDTVDADQLALQ